MGQKPKVMVGVTIHEDTLARLREVADVVPLESDQAKVAEGIKTVDGLIVYSPRFGLEVLCEAKNLKVISCHSCPPELLEQATAQGITVTLAPSLWDTVADLTLGLMFAAARNIPQAHLAIKAGEWKNHEVLKAKYSGYDIFGKMLGILGLGKIGKIVTTRVQGFNMKLLYHDLERNSQYEEQFGLSYRTLPDLLSESDILLVLVPLTETPRGLIGEKELRLMKRSAIIVHTARGGIFDQDALYQALRDRRIAAAGLDVLVDESIALENPMLALEMLFLHHIWAVPPGNVIGCWLKIRCAY